MQDYIYILKPLRQNILNSMTAAEQRIMGQHFDYLNKALTEGTLFLAGPCEDGAFGIVIFKAESPDAAGAFMEDDPAVKQGVMSAELHAMRMSLVKGRPASRE